MKKDKFSDALLYATTMHAGQMRKDEKTPYICHPIEVANMVRQEGYGEEEQIAALLHDTLEDTEAKEADILELFGANVLEAVKALTRKKGEPEEQYVNRILENHTAVVVKSADKIHNLSEICFLGTPGKARTKEEIQFVKDYVKKSAKFYERKFCRGVDSMIGISEGYCGSICHEPKTFKLGKDYLIPYPDLKKRWEDEMREKHDNNDDRPDFSDTSLRFFEMGNDLYAVKDLSKYRTKKWRLTRGGWLPEQLEFWEFTDDPFYREREEISAIIEKKRNEGYFYDFVTEDLY